MVLKNETTIPDNSELRQLIIDNLGLPLIIFAGEEAWNGEYRYTAADQATCKIEELTLFDNIWMDRDDYEDYLSYSLEDEPGYVGLSDKEFSNAISKIVADTEFIKTITIYIG